MTSIKKYSALPLAALLGLAVAAAPASTLAAPVDRSVDLSVDKSVDRSVQAPNAYGALDDAYVMRVGDVFTMTVFDYSELSREGGEKGETYNVRTDGYVNMPLIGPVYCVGKTIDEVSHEVKLRYSEFIQKPDITINLKKMGTVRVYVLGVIGKQGMYELDKSHRLMDAIAAAEGFTEYSAKRKVFVIRRGSQEASLKVNFNRLLETGDPSVNVELYEGDCVYLSNNGKFSFNKEILPWITAIDHIADAKYKIKNY